MEAAGCGPDVISLTVRPCAPAARVLLLVCTEHGSDVGTGLSNGLGAGGDGAREELRVQGKGWIQQTRQITVCRKVFKDCKNVTRRISFYTFRLLCEFLFASFRAL